MGKEITIYWSQGEDESRLPFNRQMLYLNPVNLYKEFLPSQNPDLVGQPRGKRDSSMFICPAVRDKLSRLYHVPNPVETRFQVRDHQIVPESGSGVPLTSARANSLSETLHVRSELTWFFFADEPLEVSFTSPYFHALSYLSLMQLPPAMFDVGRWFRTFNVEYVLFPRDADVVMYEGEPMFYMELHTDQAVRFVRFEFTPELAALGAACSGAPSVLGRWKSLSERYSRFHETQMRENILRLIRANVIGESDV